MTVLDIRVECSTDPNKVELFKKYQLGKDILRKR